jgi:histidinol dehydrogenase
LEAIRIIDAADARAVAALLAPRREDDRRTARRAAAIVEAVRRDGDRAVARFARRFDGLEDEFEVPRTAWQAATRRLSPQLRRALRTAATHIAAVARAQVPKGTRTRVGPGITVTQRVQPLDRVGCYVPAGRYPLPSSLLMTAVPARVAGVPDIVAVCPRPDDTVLAAAAVAGVTRLFRLGGAHAIGALAFGTDTIPRVDRIVGPGNKYVAAAKNYVSTECGIDMQAGPSEILIVSRTGRPTWLAADLIAQAEHDVDARALLVTWSRRLASAVAREIQRQLPVDGPARESLTRHGGIILTRGRDEAIALANRMAPEHLVVDDDRTAREVRCAGAIFVGAHTAQVAGDYAIGSNHVLPTGGAARVRGGLNAADFVRVVSVQRLTSRGLARLGPTVRTLARAEGLVGHARSIEVRNA